MHLAFELSRLMRKKMASSQEEDGCANWLQIHALRAIQEHPSLTMKEFAAALRITSPSATSSVNRLVKLKLVKRVSDHANRKLVRLQLTPDAETMLRQTLRRKRDSVHQSLQFLSQDDQRELARILHHLVQSLRAADHL